MAIFVQQLRGYLVNYMLGKCVRCTELFFIFLWIEERQSFKGSLTQAHTHTHTHTYTSLPLSTTAAPPTKLHPRHSLNFTLPSTPMLQHTTCKAPNHQVRNECIFFTDSLSTQRRVLTWISMTSPAIHTTGSPVLTFILHFRSNCQGSSLPLLVKSPGPNDSPDPAVIECTNQWKCCSLEIEPGLLLVATWSGWGWGEKVCTVLCSWQVCARDTCDRLCTRSCHLAGLTNHLPCFFYVLEMQHHPCSRQPSYNLMQFDCKSFPMYLYSYRFVLMDHTLNAPRLPWNASICGKSLPRTGGWTGSEWCPSTLEMGGAQPKLTEEETSSFTKQKVKQDVWHEKTTNSNNKFFVQIQSRVKWKKVPKCTRKLLFQLSWKWHTVKDKWMSLPQTILQFYGTWSQGFTL